MTTEPPGRTRPLAARSAPTSSSMCSKTLKATALECSRLGSGLGDYAQAYLDAGIPRITTTQPRHGQISQPGGIVVRRRHRLEGLRLERRITGHRVWRRVDEIVFGHGLRLEGRR